MADSFKPLRVVLLAVVVIAVGVLGSRLLEKKERIPWQADYPSARVVARASGKPMFLYFTASWCGPCQSLKSTVWSDAAVASELSRYVPVKLDVDLPSTRDLALKYGVEDAGIPFFVVLDPSGNVVRTGVGAVPPDTFVRWLRGEGKLNA